VLELTLVMGGRRRFVGVEYVVVESQAPALFVIHKRDRTSPTEGTSTLEAVIWMAEHTADVCVCVLPAKTIAVYYVLNDNVYQAPTLYSVINERVVRSVSRVEYTDLTYTLAADIRASPLDLPQPTQGEETNLDSRTIVRVGHQAPTNRSIRSH
jgi:hypothetical protein